MTIKSFQIIGEATDVQLEQITSLMHELQVEAEIAEINRFDDWLDFIVNEELVGFQEQANNWIRSWGNGGGDEGTVTMITELIESNNPTDWAEEAYAAISGYTKTSFEAAVLIMALVEDVLNDYKKNQMEQLNMKKLLLANEVVQQAIAEIKKHPECEGEDLASLHDVIKNVEDFLNSGEKVLHMDLNLWEGVFDGLDSIMEEYGLVYSEKMDWENKENGMITFK